MTLAEAWENQGFERGIERGIEQGIEQGTRRGVLQGRKEIALAMLSKGFAVEAIADVTGLSSDQIEDFIA